MEASSETNRQPIETSASSGEAEQMVVLQPVSIQIFDGNNIYLPSRKRSSKKISYKEFLLKYADYPIQIRVCLNSNCTSETLLQNSQQITAYGFGFDGWYIIQNETLESNS